MFIQPGYLSQARLDATITRTVTPVTFSASSNSASRSIGTAAASRIVVVTLSWSASQTLSSLTVAGVAMTIVQASVAGVGTTYHSAIGYLAVPSSTTATIAMSFSGTVNAAFEVFAIYDAAALIDSDTASGTSSSQSINLDTSRGGVVVAVAANESDTNTASWSGATEVSDLAIGTSARYTSGTDAPTATASGAAVTVTWSLPRRNTLVGLSFR